MAGLGRLGITRWDRTGADLIEALPGTVLVNRGSVFVLSSEAPCWGGEGDAQVRHHRA